MVTSWERDNVETAAREVKSPTQEFFVLYVSFVTFVNMKDTVMSLMN